LEGKTDKKWWEKLATPAEFDEKIVNRMGKEFYEKVFSPTIEKLYREGKKYEEIRDSVRKEWNELLKT
jgi:putative lipoic acid-binding regulatory protein